MVARVSTGTEAVLTEIIIGAPPKQSMIPIEEICKIDENGPELSVFSEFLFDFLNHIPSEAEKYITRKAAKLNRPFVYVTKYKEEDKVKLMYYFSKYRLSEPIKVDLFNMFEQNDQF